MVALQSSLKAPAEQITNARLPKCQFAAGADQVGAQPGAPSLTLGWVQMKTGEPDRSAQEAGAVRQQPQTKTGIERIEQKSPAGSTLSSQPREKKKNSQNMAAKRERLVCTSGLVFAVSASALCCGVEVGGGGVAISN